MGAAKEAWVVGFEAHLRRKGVPDAQIPGFVAGARKFRQRYATLELGLFEPPLVASYARELERSWLMSAARRANAKVCAHAFVDYVTSLASVSPLQAARALAKDDDAAVERVAAPRPRASRWSKGPPLVMVVLAVMVAGFTVVLGWWNRPPPSRSDAPARGVHERLHRAFSSHIAGYLDLERFRRADIDEPTLRGRVVPVAVDRREIDVEAYRRLPVAARASRPEDVDTLLWVRFDRPRKRARVAIVDVHRREIRHERVLVGKGRSKESHSRDAASQDLETLVRAYLANLAYEPRGPSPQAP